ncbi:dTDP-4-dehydrorhamnose reductase [Rhodobacteraceae bacterium XHP0102]|nr:dTDP-4-dehydrorhamnose reductase [Rhodobacteraceae bacterium XHP0102]
MILIFGKTGQVARALADLVPDALFLDRTAADLTDPAACAAAILAHNPAVIINAAAYTAVDAAEADPETAFAVNRDAPAAMAKAAAQIGALFLHISTDYVFDGQGDAPFAPDAPTAPLSVYGKSKAAGEAAVMAAGGVAAILRCSWVFSPYGGNFVKTMLRLAENRDRLSIVHDQIGGPTPAHAIAEALLQMATALKEKPKLAGIYHFSGTPDTSWADFATEIFTQSGHQVTITPIPTRDYPTPATRPLNSRLDCSTTMAAFGIARPEWRAYLADVINSSQTIA